MSTVAIIISQPFYCHFS